MNVMLTDDSVAAQIGQTRTDVMTDFDFDLESKLATRARFRCGIVRALLPGLRCTGSIPTLGIRGGGN